MTVEDRIYRYAERKFQQSGMTEFPTVREVARGLGLTQNQVVEACDGDDQRLMRTYYNTTDERDGDWFVETLTEDSQSTGRIHE